jgi:hypothetical protein
MLPGGRAVGAALALALLAVTPVSAHTRAAGDPGVILGRSAELGIDGLYRVRLADGATLSTHGPDPRQLAAGEAGGIREGPRRKPACADSHVTRFAIGRPAGTGRSAAMARAVRATVARANAVLSDAARFSGGPGADLKVACDRRGRPQVERFRTRAHAFAAVVSAARRAGLHSRSANFLLFVPGRHGDACGTSSFRADDRPSAENANREGGAYAVIYGRCRSSAEILLHEVGHMMGAVQYGAPFSTGIGRHCWDELDVLCYAPDGGNLHQQGVLSRCLMVAFDCGYDTYFDAAPEPREYLATHWNLGSRLNRFLRFGP